MIELKNLTDKQVELIRNMKRQYESTSDDFCLGIDCALDDCPLQGRACPHWIYSNRKKSYEIICAYLEKLDNPKKSTAYEIVELLINQSAKAGCDIIPKHGDYALTIAKQGKDIEITLHLTEGE